MTGSSGPSAPPPAAVESTEISADLQARRRGVLKKDSSYDDTLRPILKNNPERAQSSTDTIPILQGSKLNDSAGALSSTSSEDLENFIDANNRGFVGKIILEKNNGDIFKVWTKNHYPYSHL